MNVNFEAIEKAWFKPKKNIIKVNLDLKGIKNLENYITDLEQNRYVLDELEKELKRTIKEHEVYDKENKCAWSGYYFYYEILNKIQELKKELV